MMREMWRFDPKQVQLQFTVEWCDMCGHHIRCPGCGNNSCNGGYGEVDGKMCIICPLAYQYQSDMWAMMHRHSGLSDDDYEAIYREMDAAQRTGSTDDKEQR